MRKFLSILLIFCALPALAQVARSEVRAGNRKFRKDRFKEAEIDYRKAALKDSLSVTAEYNLASALYRQQDYAGAAKALETVKEQEALRERRRPVRLLVPVDIRGMLSSRTMRNAFLTVAVGIDPKLGPWSFDEILNEVHHTMRLRRARPHIAPVLTSSLKAQSNPFLRPIPSLFKDRILRLVHRNRASKRYTALLSNLGDVKWDFDGAEGIRDLEMVPNPNPVAGLQLGMVGWRGRLVLGCASLLPAPWFERDLMRALQRYETHLEVEANWC